MLQSQKNVSFMAIPKCRAVCEDNNKLADTLSG